MAINLDQIRIDLIGDDERGFDFLSPETLKPLTELALPSRGILSAYLDISPEEVATGQVRLKLKNMAREWLENITDKQERRAFEEEVGRVENYLRYEIREPGRTLVIFSSKPADLWRVFHVPVRIRTRLVWDERPYLRPLLTVMDEYERYGVVLVSREESRFFLFYMGEIAEYSFSLYDYVPNRHKRGGWSQARFQRHVDDHALHHFKSTAEIAARLAERDNWQRVVLMGTYENVAQVKEYLPKAIRERVAGEIPAGIHDSVNVIRDKVLALEQEIERQIEAQRVEAVITAAEKGQNGVLGYADVLLAVQEGRVDVLIVPEGLEHPGWECERCGGLIADILAKPPDACPYCGGPLKVVEDVVDLAMQKVLSTGGTVEVLRGPIRAQFEKEGIIGALLRY
ncbi:MAG: hypothetical protein GXO55_02570 [Chloroflexi bacterium]|nr:hypothetical protein [Chloroflexota bacterium]